MSIREVWDVHAHGAPDKELQGANAVELASALRAYVKEKKLPVDVLRANREEGTVRVQFRAGGVEGESIAHKLAENPGVEMLRFVRRAGTPEAMRAAYPQRREGI